VLGNGARVVLPDLPVAFCHATNSFRRGAYREKRKVTLTKAEIPPTVRVGSRPFASKRQKVISPQLFRQLRQNDALALLTVGGNAYDAVLTMPPVFIAPSRSGPSARRKRASQV
jgi:hypothetical protein